MGFDQCSGLFQRIGQADVAHVRQQMVCHVHHRPGEEIGPDNNNQPQIVGLTFADITHAGHDVGRQFGIAPKIHNKVYGVG